MEWASFADFISMGGRGGYVWGSYGVTVVCIVLELVDPTALPWIRVRHRDGIAGYVRPNDVWGL